MYSREEVKALTDKILNMAKADAVEVNFSGGERSATRFANSSITTNLVQYDQQVSVTVYGHALRLGAAAREFDDDVAEGDGRRGARRPPSAAATIRPAAAGRRDRRTTSRWTRRCRAA